MESIGIWGKGKSARALARAMGCVYNRKARILIRYKRLDVTPCRSLEVNSAHAIRNASHKYKSLVIWKGLRLPVIPFSKKVSDLDRSKIIFGRDFYHTKGADIVVYQPGSQPGLHEYYVEYVKSESEYRYHVAFGKVILATKKVLAEGEEDDTLIRNHQDGKWKQVVVRARDSFSDVCIKAVAALELHFGAVDFLCVNGKPVLLEVNTAPGLQIQNRLDAYTKIFKEELC